MAVQINVAANQAALVASIQAGVQAYNQRFANNNQINLNINARAFSQPLGRITGDVKDFEAALAASNARVIAFGASTAVLGGVIRSFKELASVTIDVEKNLADINRVFGLTTSQLQKFSTELFNVSKLTASSFNDASKAALEFSRQGLKAEDTLQRTKDALTLTRLAGISTANAVDALTSTVNGFAATGISTTQILNKLVAVEQDYAVGAGDLAEALSRTGQAAQEAGVSLDQLNALVTAAQQSTARGGAVIGNALKTIFTRLQRTETLDQLEAFNIAVRDVQGNILPAVTILQNFAGAYKNLADAQKAQLSEQVAGVYQVNILKAVVNDLNNAQGVYAGALQRGASATNEAEVATAKLNRTLDALLSQTATSAQQLANNIGKVTFEPLARYGTEQLKSLVESMNEILEGEGIGSTFANGLLKGIRNILAGPGAIAAFFTLFKLIQNSFTYLSQALPQIAGITTETQNRKNIEQSILQIMQQQGPLSQALAGTMGNQAAQAQLLLQLARQQTAEYQQQSALAKQLAVQLSGQGVKVAGARGLQVTRAGGYVPPATRMAEVVGAQAGGYSPGKVVASPVGGVMNTAEDVKYIPGFAQPFINPPANSKAGRAHRQNAINRTGVDPYTARGFVPNFAKLDERDYTFTSPSGKSFDKKQRSNNSYSILINEVSSDSLGAEKDLDLVGRNLDAGLNNQTKKPNTIYDWVSGIIDVRKFLNKDQVDSAITNLWTGLLKNDKNLIKKGQSIGLSNNDLAAVINTTKRKVGFTLSELKEKYRLSLDPQAAQDNEYFKYKNSNKSGIKAGDPIKTAEGFENSLNGDYQNFIGDAYEKLISKIPGVSDKFVISQKQTSPADLIPDPTFIGPHPIQGIESKAGGAFLSQLIKKAIRINIKSRADDNRDKDLNFGTLPVYQPFGSDIQTSFRGFIPNFSPLIDDNARNKHDFPGGVPILPIPDKALQNIVDRQKKRQMTYLDFDRTLVRTMGDIAYSRVSPDQKKGVLQKMFLNKEARLNDIKSSKLTQFGELLRKKIQEGVINPSLLGLLTASDETPGMPEYISSIWGIPKRNQIYSAKPGTKEAKLASLGVSASGFIPNFAIPMQAARIPWFKKYSSLFKNSAGDKDVFRQKDFPTFGNGLDHRYAKEGNADVIGSLYEKFIRNAMNIARNSNVFKTNKEMGFDEMLTTTGNTAPFDFFENLGSGDFRGIQAKAGSKNNQSSGGGVTQTLTKNIARFAGTNPKDIDRLKEATLVYNDPKYIDPTGKNISARFTPFELSIAALVKDSFANVDPNIKPKLQQLTDSLLNQYNQIKNTANPRINAGGFIPNFAMGDKMRTRMMKDNLRVIVHDLKTGKEAYAQPGKKGKEYLYHKDAYNAELKTSGANVNDYDFAELHNLVRGFIYPNGKIVWDYSEKQQEALKDPNIKAKILAKLLAVETRIPKSIELSKPLTDFQRTRALLNNSYSGFIPNFAYKQSVMGLEESMSGNKAIFDTKPFPHIRNSSQPTFSSAIADHGGLGNALSDSMRGQKAAGLMSKGFIPNFGPIRSFKRKAQKNETQNTQSSFDPNQLESEVEKYAQQALTDIKNGFKSTIDKIKSMFSKVDTSVSSVGMNEINSLRQRSFKGTQNAQQASTGGSQNNSRFAKFSENLSKASTAIAIVGPAVAGFAEQAVFGNKKRIEMTATERTVQSGLSTGLSAVSTGAGIGAAFGPVGAGIGAAAGALVGFISALDAAKLSAEDLAEMADNQKQNTQQNISAGQKYVQAQEEYAKLLASGASSDKLELASRNLSDSFNQITDVKLADELSKTKGGVEALNSVLSKFESDKNILTAALSFAAGVKGGKVQGGVQIGERVKELKSIGLSKEQISQLQSFKLEKERITRYISGGVGGVSKIDAEVVKESSLKTAKQISEDIAKSAIGNKGTAEEIKAFQESILQLLFGENKDELLKQLSSGNQLLTNAVEIAKKEANLLKLRNDLNLAILKQINDANTQLEQADFGRKLLDEINNFKFSLAEGILSPLSIASEKSKAQRTKAIAEGQDELTKLNLNFVKENQEKFLKLTPSSEVIQGQIKPALEKAQAGDFSGIQKILSGASVSQMLTGNTGFDPATVTDLKKAFEDFNRAIDKQKRNNSNQLQLLDTQDRIEQIRARTTEFQATLLQKQIQLLGDQERVEATRKTNAELEIDAIERRMADQGNFLGRGVVGKAESKIALRNEVTRKKLIDLEISRSKSAQSDYQSLIEKQQINLTKSAAASELEGRPIQALGLRQQARNLKSIDITNSETLSQAIDQLKTSSFADPTLDTERVRTLEKLKAIQNDIANGKLKEEEITKRINAEELKNAKRSTSIIYGFKEGFDALRDEADTGLNRLAKDTPALFRDGMVNAIKAAVKETDNLGDALLGVAANFLDTISTRLMEVGVSKLISSSGIESLFTAQKGGLIRAQSGMYVSGTGTGDKYPALLENGEYVLNKNAVMAMGGPAALDTLNFSAAPRFASGGSFNTELGDIKAMEENMTTFGLENSSYYKELRDEEIRKAEEARQKKRARDAQIAQIVGSVVASVATAAIGAGISNVASNMQAKAAEKMVQSGTGAIASAGLATYGDTPQLYAETGLSKAEVGNFQKFVSSGYINPSGMSTIKTPRTGFKSILPPSIKPAYRRQTGGLIGSRLSDTIPGYMEGGLYNSPIVKKYGIGMQGGGSSSMVGSSLSTVNNNNANNAFNFNTTVSREGNIEIGANTTSYKQQDVELSNNLNSKIYGAVLDVIRDQQRFGGSLAGTRKA